MEPIGCMRFCHSCHGQGQKTFYWWGLCRQPPLGILNVGMKFHEHAVKPNNGDMLIPRYGHSRRLSHGTCQLKLVKQEIFVNPLQNRLNMEKIQTRNHRGPWQPPPYSYASAYKYVCAPMGVCKESYARKTKSSNKNTKKHSGESRSVRNGLKYLQLLRACG